MIELDFLKNAANSTILYNTLVFRYMDDIAIFYNDFNHFDTLVRMYPDSLTLEPANIHYDTASFLDLQITRLSSSWSVNMYNKTDDYSFNVIRFPMYDSYINNNIKLNCILGEIIRINRCTSSILFFKEKINQLIHKLRSNQYPLPLIASTFKKAMYRYPFICLKYDSNNKTMIAWFNSIT